MERMHALMHHLFNGVIFLTRRLMPWKFLCFTSLHPQVIFATKGPLSNLWRHFQLSKLLGGRCEGACSDIWEVDARDSVMHQTPPSPKSYPAPNIHVLYRRGDGILKADPSITYVPPICQCQKDSLWVILISCNLEWRLGWMGQKDQAWHGVGRWRWL